MPKDATDQLFEDLFGFPGGDPKPEPTVSAQAPRPAASAPSTTSAPEPITVEEAAQALVEALRAHTGRRRPVKTWKPVVARALGTSRLYQKRYDAVLAKGVELGLFTIDETSLSYPVLVTSPEPEPEPVDEEWEAYKAQQERERAERTQRNKPPPPPEQPADWKPLGHLPCGHWKQQSVKVERDAGDAKRVGPDSRLVMVEKVEDCHHCKAGRPGHPQYQQEGYRTPVPLGMRRTPERERSLGFPGYCTDPETGMYIGGIANYCRFANPKGPWCIVHGG